MDGNLDTAIPLWRAYRELFGAMMHMRNASIDLPGLARELTAAARDPKGGYFSLTYSASSLRDYCRPGNPNRTGLPPPDKRTHLHLWLSEQVKKMGSPPKLTEYLAVIAPNHNDGSQQTQKGVAPLLAEKGHFNETNSFIKCDWGRPDVIRFIGEYNILSVLDGAIVLYNGPEQAASKCFWSADDITLDIDKNPILLDELLTFKDEIRTWEEKNKGQSRGMKYTVTEIDVPTLEGSKGLILRVRPIEYHFVKPINQILENSCINNDNPAKVNEAAQFRKRHFGSLLDRDFPSIPNLLNVQITVISSDNKILFFRRRRQRMDSFLCCWSASIEEGVNADMERYLGIPNVPLCSRTDFRIKDVLRRALDEETKLADSIISRADIRVLSVLLEYENLNIALGAVAHIPLSAHQILSNPALRSSPEFDGFAFCSFDIPSLLPVLQSKNALPAKLVSPNCNPDDLKKDWKWHPTSRMRIYSCLVDQFGSSTVNENI